MWLNLDGMQLSERTDTARVRLREGHRRVRYVKTGNRALGAGGRGPGEGRWEGVCNGDSVSGLRGEQSSGDGER